MTSVISLSWQRRELLKMLAIGFGCTVVGVVALSMPDRLTLSFPPFRTVASVRLVGILGAPVGSAMIVRAARFMFLRPPPLEIVSGRLVVRPPMWRRFSSDLAKVNVRVEPRWLRVSGERGRRSSIARALLDESNLSRISDAVQRGGGSWSSGPP